ncbi:MAG: TerB N-terminal domain-containing protein [Treponema sp.]|jgi:hypothetical protein|nr:TerB N-terminal domain-containing protein [Treponema sp.]
MGIFDLFRRNKHNVTPSHENKEIIPIKDNYSPKEDNEPKKEPLRTIEINPEESTAVIPSGKNVDFGSFKIHDDLIGLVWIADGKYKNYTHDNKQNYTFEYGGYRVSIKYPGLEEPSLIYTNQKIAIPSDESAVSRPPYYPTYSGLTPEQKWIYLKLLTNPYNTSIDIGFVFILYYGLERHLLSGEFERVFRLIIKLRDVHSNGSFQNYSANALILSAMLHKRGDMVLEFINSLDKDYELNFWNNLFLICYYSFNLPLCASDIMRIAGTFEFTNKNYIKKYPEIFETILRDTLREKAGKETILISDYITAEELRNIKLSERPIFANTSMNDQRIPVPLIAENANLKKTMFDFLNTAHEKTKIQITKMRKDGTLSDPAHKPKTKTSASSILAEEANQDGQKKAAKDNSCNNKAPAIPDFDSDNDIFDGYQYLATLDTRTCLACGLLDGKIFKHKEDIPKHSCFNDNCRCVLVPYVKGFEDIPGERAAMDGPVSDKMTWVQWFEKQKVVIKKEILGQERYKMYRSGIPLSDFVANYKELTLEQLGDKLKQSGV